MYKQAWRTCKVVVLLIKPSVFFFFTFSLPSASLNLKVRNNFLDELAQKHPLCKVIQDRLGFWISRCGFQIPGTGFKSLSVGMDSDFQTLRGSQAVFRIPKPKIPDSMSKSFPDSWFYKKNFLDSGSRIPIRIPLIASKRLPRRLIAFIPVSELCTSSALSFFV